MKKKTGLISVLVILFTTGLVYLARLGLTGTLYANADKHLQLLLPYLLPGSSTFTEEVYEGQDESIKSVYKGENGYVIRTSTQGYVGEVELLVGVSNRGEVVGLTVRDLEETYGLGANVCKDVDFLVQFLTTKGEAQVGSTVDALTGATVSSKAVTKGVNSAIAYVTGADISSGATEWGG